MSHRRIAGTTMVLALCWFAVTGAAAHGENEEQGFPPVVQRVYPVYYMTLEEARLLIEEKKPEIMSTGNYQIRFERVPDHRDDSDTPNGYLRVFTEEKLHEGIGEILETYDIPVKTQVFQIFLLEASMQSSSRPDLPAGAKKALDDLDDLFPFKSYRLVDTAMIRTSSESMVNLSEDFMVGLVFRSHRKGGKPLMVEEFQLRKLVMAPKKDSGSDVLTIIDSRSILQTSFSMQAGETIVVGTSKLNGDDEALIVLLTALP